MGRPERHSSCFYLKAFPFSNHNENPFRYRRRLFVLLGSIPRTTADTTHPTNRLFDPMKTAIMCTSLDELVEELESYALNYDTAIYQATNKVVRGVWLRTSGGSYSHGWDQRKALKCVEKGLVTPAAKDYHREFGNQEEHWAGMWPMHIRAQAAKSILACWLLDFEEDHG